MEEPSRRRVFVEIDEENRILHVKVEDVPWLTDAQLKEIVD